MKISSVVESNEDLEKSDCTTDHWFRSAVVFTNDTLMNWNTQGEPKERYHGEFSVDLNFAGTPEMVVPEWASSSPIRR